MAEVEPATPSQGDGDGTDALSSEAYNKQSSEVLLIMMNEIIQNKASNFLINQQPRSCVTDNMELWEAFKRQVKESKGGRRGSVSTSLARLKESVLDNKI